MHTTQTWMPIDQVDYASSAVFINVSHSDPWLQNVSMAWEFPSVPLFHGPGDHALLGLETAQKNAESPRWWFPWLNPRVFVNVTTLDDVLPALRAVGGQRINRLRIGVHRERGKFIYRWGVGGLPGALDIILDNISHFVGAGCQPHILPNATRARVSG
jgi:hypothetical protein